MLETHVMCRFGGFLGPQIQFQALIYNLRPRWLLKIAAGHVPEVKSQLKGVDHIFPPVMIRKACNMPF